MVNERTTGVVERSATEDAAAFIAAGCPLRRVRELSDQGWPLDTAIAEGGSGEHGAHVLPLLAAATSSLNVPVANVPLSVRSTFPATNDHRLATSERGPSERTTSEHDAAGEGEVLAGVSG